MNESILRRTELIRRFNPNTDPVVASAPSPDLPLYNGELIFGEKLIDQIDQLRLKNKNGDEFELHTLLEKAREDLANVSTYHMRRTAAGTKVPGEEIESLFKQVMQSRDIGSELLLHIDTICESHFDALSLKTYGSFTSEQIRQLPLNIVEGIFRFHIDSVRLEKIELENRVNTYSQEFIDIFTNQLNQLGIDAQSVIEKAKNVEVVVVDSFSLKESSWDAKVFWGEGKKSTICIPTELKQRNVRKYIFHEWLHAISGRVSVLYPDKLQDLKTGYSLNELYESNERLRYGYNELSEGMTELLALALDNGIPFNQLTYLNEDVVRNGIYRGEVRMLLFLLSGKNKKIDPTIFINSYLEDYSKSKSGFSLPYFIEMHKAIDQTFGQTGFLAKLLKVLYFEWKKGLADEDNLSVSEVIKQVSEDPDSINQLLKQN